MAKNDKETATGQPQSESPRLPRVKWDTTGIKSSYANFANANMTREEVVFNFGVNQTWDRSEGGEYEVELSHRIAMSPFAAKRLASLLNNLIAEYERRYGELK
jgi:Protein of unknown function (DUF3467)